MGSFHLLEVVGRGSETQLQVVEFFFSALRVRVLCATFQSGTHHNLISRGRCQAFFRSQPFLRIIQL